MDIDKNNFNDAAHDRTQWWEDKVAEFKAHLEKLDAERRLEQNDAFENFKAEYEAASDWTEASWDEFKAKVQAWWNEAEIKTDEAI